jgi:AAA family ATP:ADP antiporter
MMANVALVFSGQYVKYVSTVRGSLPVGADPWGHALKLLMGAVVAGGAVILGTFTYIQKKVPIAHISSLCDLQNYANINLLEGVNGSCVC